ncbi:MAG: DUF255 domain-containing protein [Ferruginibacter sp.]
MRYLFSFFTFLLPLLVSTSSFMSAPKEEVNWLTMEELQVQYAKEPRPIIIDLYTDWCGWCKVMDSKTYTNPKLAAYINEHYYAVKYNAESQKDISFNNIAYKYNTHYRTNDLAMYLTFGRLEFPTTIFLSSLDARPAPLSGYMKPAQMEAPLKYFAERKDVTQSFVDFNKKMKKEW